MWISQDGSTGISASDDMANLLKRFGMGNRDLYFVCCSCVIHQLLFCLWQWTYCSLARVLI